jgi:DinB superfamily
LYDERADLLTALKAGPVVLRTLLSSTRADATARPTDEGWDAVEIVCHLRDAGRIALERDQLMQAEERPALKAFDQDELATRGAYARQDMVAALREFEEIRARHVAFLESLAAADWDRIGVHEEFGEITIKQHVAHMAAHDPLHFAQLARLQPVAPAR